MKARPFIRTWRYIALRPVPDPGHLPGRETEQTHIPEEHA
jgi:hypothetical protein